MQGKMYELIRPLLFRLDPETAHDCIRALGSVASFPPFKHLINPFFHFEHPSLEISVAGMKFSSPIGLAAGFDKNAEMISLMESLGFGFVEIGSATAQPSSGNPRPRLFRLPSDEALINRMGLGNDGIVKISERLKQQHSVIPVGLNIAKTNKNSVSGENAIQDYVYTYQHVPETCSYITLNISCPNTPDGRTFEDVMYLAELLSAIQTCRNEKNNKQPLLLKLSADLTFSQIDVIINTAKEFDVQGYVVTNTSSGRENVLTDEKILSRIGLGGLSGAPIQKKSTGMIKHIYTNFDKPLLIGVGGIFSAEDAYEKVRAGASLLQLYTALVYRGPSVVKNIKRGLVELLQRDGYSSIEQAIGNE